MPNEWVSVKDRLPPKLKDVLCFFPEKDYGSKIQVSYREGKGFAEEFKWGDATHWMPLPPHPKEGHIDEEA